MQHFIAFETFDFEYTNKGTEIPENSS